MFRNRIFIIFLSIGIVSCAGQIAHLPNECSINKDHAKEPPYLLNPISNEEMEIAELFMTLELKESGTYKLIDSNSTLTVPEGYHLLLGEEARKSIRIGTDLNPEYLEGVLTDNENIIFLEVFRTGYQSLEDWSSIDPDELTDITPQENEESTYYEAVIQEPTIDKTKNIIHWATEEFKNSEVFVNTYIVQLGRDGFVRLTCNTPKECDSSYNDTVEFMLKIHSFNPGYQYTDYRADANPGSSTGSSILTQISLQKAVDEENPPPKH